VLVREVAAMIVADGRTPFLHAAASNENAIRLYEALGFRLRRGVQFVGVQAPQA
jgi:predicted GNAT family acetyltransferase